MSLHWFLSNPFSRRVVPLIACTLLFPVLLCAQEDIRVEQLYGAAKSAQSRGDSSAAIADYQQLIQIAPRLAAAYNNLGMLYLDQRDYPKAADVLKKGLALDPHMPSASALLGIALFEMGRYGDSRTALQTALRANPADENAQLFLAKDLIQLGQTEAAAAALRPLAERQPRNQEVWYLLGQVYMQMSKQALAKMSAINPDSSLVHEISGEMMEDMKNYQGALVEYKKAIAVAPNQVGTHYHLGNLYWKLSQWDDSLRQFRAELVNDPYNCRAYAQIGNILASQQSQPETGLEDLDKALSLCPDLTQAHLDRGEALLKLNRTQPAIAELQTAGRSEPDNPMPHFFLARAWKALGNTTRMHAEMEIYAKLQASASEVVAARAAEVEKAAQDQQPQHK